MSDNLYEYSKSEEILENPGILCFKLDNNNSSFQLGKNANGFYSERDVKEIKSSIVGVFQDISEKVTKYQDQNPEYLGHISNNLNFAYNNKKKFNFPGLQVINMDREKLNYFTHWPERFLLCEKSDGVRYLLIQYKNGVCHLVGRSLEFFEIVCSEKLPPLPYFNNKMCNEWSIEYLLDGELILDDVDQENDDKTKFIKLNGKFKKINFLIFDAVVIKGENFGFMPFKKRLERFSRLFLEEYLILKYIKTRGKCFLNKYKNELQKSEFSIPKLKKDINLTVQGTNSKIKKKTDNKSISLFIKDYYTFSQVKKLNDLIKLLPHHNDGLIINTDDYPYYSGQSCEIFKWKPLNMNTIDFEIVYNKEIDRYILYITTKEGNCPVEILSFKDDSEKKEFQNEFRKNNKNIGECFYDNQLCNKEVAINNYNLKKIKNESNDDISGIINRFIKTIPNDIEKYKGGWRFLKFRNDKLNANFINTYQNIKICIKEDVTMKEIIDTIEKNKNKRLPDLENEKNFVSALVWKKFFKKNDKKDDDEELFYDNDKPNNSNENDLLNKKRERSDKDDEDNDNDNNFEEPDIDKLYDDDFDDD